MDLRRNIVFGIFLPLMVVIFWHRTVSAVPFGIADPRGFAMGGAAVASARSESAALYNPALLATKAQNEDEHRAKSTSSPLFSAVISDQVFDLADFENRNFHQRLTDSILAYNSNQSPATARSVAQISQELDGSLDGFANNPLLGDVHGGVVIAVPSIAEGGSFFAVSRVLGVGIAEVTEHDRALLNAYTEGLTFIASGGSSGTEQPQLFEPSGALIDLTDTLESTLHGKGMIASEIGVSLATQIEHERFPLWIGISPKIQSISYYDYFHTVNDNNATFTRSDNAQTRLNLDVGLAADLTNHWRAGVTLKNIVPRQFTSSLGNTFQLEPQLRSGIAYQGERFTIAADVDLLPSAALTIEDKNQFVGVGAEWLVFNWLALRSGAQVDARNSATRNLLTAGVGFSFLGTYLDMSVGRGAQTQMWSIQFGFQF